MARVRLFGVRTGTQAGGTGAHDENGVQTIIHERVELLDGGNHAYPRMLCAISSAKRHIYLEIYSFAHDNIGKRFVQSLADAACREVEVRVVIDGWGSAFSARHIAAELRSAGCNVRIYNRLRALWAGRFARTHRKMLLVDDDVAFIGGINIGDENTQEGDRLGWADLALELHGPPCAYLGRVFRGEPHGQLGQTLEIHFSRLGEGWRLRRLYVRAMAHARKHVLLAHGYFLPDPQTLRAIVAAARRGVRVQLLLPGRSDVPLARAATRSLYGRLLRAGVDIHEWGGSVLHAKVACIDSRVLLIGSFNLDPFSLANREVLVQICDPHVATQGEAWIAERLLEARAVTIDELGTRIRRWLFDPMGLLVVRAAVLLSRMLMPARRRHYKRCEGPTARRSLRRIAVTIIGFIVLATGVAMVVLPGPAVVVVPLGLGILATEYRWARTLLQRFKERAIRFAHRRSRETERPDQH